MQITTDPGNSSVSGEEKMVQENTGGKWVSYRVVSSCSSFMLGSNGDIWNRGWKSHEAKEELSLVTTQQLHPPNTCGQDGTRARGRKVHHPWKPSESAKKRGRPKSWMQPLLRPLPGFLQMAKEGFLEMMCNSNQRGCLVFQNTSIADWLYIFPLPSGDIWLLLSHH